MGYKKLDKQDEGKFLTSEMSALIINYDINKVNLAFSWRGPKILAECYSHSKFRHDRKKVIPHCKFFIQSFTFLHSVKLETFFNLIVSDTRLIIIYCYMMTWFLCLKICFKSWNESFEQNFIKPNRGPAPGVHWRPPSFPILFENIEKFQLFLHTNTTRDTFLIKYA